MRKIILVCMLAVLGLFSSIGFAADPAPLAMLKSVSATMTAELDKNLGNLKNNDALIYRLVNRVLVPHFDLAGMSRSVVGKDWQAATSANQQEFVKEFTRYVVRTYGSALESYNGETIKFYPMRGDVSGQSRVQVNSDIVQKNGSSIQVQYRLAGAGSNWLVYDFSVDGVSIVQNYRSQFSATLRQGGLSKLVQELKQHNKTA